MPWIGRKIMLHPRSAEYMRAGKKQIPINRLLTLRG
jgi:hypothetical protein